MEASRPLLTAMREGGLSADAAVQACRLLMWATVGFVAMEQGSSLHAPGARRGRLSGSNPAGVTPQEADELFEIQIGFITAGVARLHERLNLSVEPVCARTWCLLLLNAVRIAGGARSLNCALLVGAGVWGRADLNLRPSGCELRDRLLGYKRTVGVRLIYPLTWINSPITRLTRRPRRTTKPGVRGIFVGLHPR